MGALAPQNSPRTLARKGNRRIPSSRRLVDRQGAVRRPEPQRIRQRLLHLAKLRSMNLVETRRDRQMIYYSCRSASVRRLLETLEEIFGKR